MTGIKVKDVEGTELEVSPDEAMSGLAAGRFSLASERVRVVQGDNRTGYVSAAEAPKALAQGWRLGTEEEASQAKLRREASSVTGTIKHGTIAAARGASLGLTDVGLEATGLVSAEELAAGQEALGEAGTALEVAGGIAATAATGGTGGAAQVAGRGTAALTAKQLARRGLGAVAAPTKYATRAGTAVERAVLGGAEAAEVGFGRRIVASAAGGATEGALGGLGGAVSESVIHDKPLTAEALVGGALAGAAFGGALSGGASYAGGTLGRVLQGLHPRTGKPVSDEALRDVLGRDAGIDPAQVPDQLVAAARADTSVLGNLAEKVAPWSGADPAIAKRVFTQIEQDPKRVQDLLARKGQIEQEIAETFQTKFNTIRNTLDEARKRAQGEGKYSSMAGKLPKNADFIAPRLSDELRSSIRTKIDGWQQTNTKRGHEAYEAAALNRLERMWARLDDESIVQGEKAVVRIPKGQPGAGRIRKKTASDFGDEGDRSMTRYRGFDRFKRDLDGLIDDTGGWGAPKEGTDVKKIDFNKELRQLYSDLRRHLEREDLWGDVAIHQRELNESFGRSARSSAEFTKIATASGVRGLFDPNTPISQRQMVSLARQYGRIGGSEVVTKMDEVLDRQLEHLDVIRNQYDLSREELHSHQAAKDAVRDLRDRLGTLAEDAALLDDLESLREAESARSVSMGALSSVGPAAGGLVGAAVAGPLGAAAGLVGGSVLRPYTSARTMASLLSMSKRFGMRFDGKSLVAKLRAGYSRAGIAAAEGLSKAKVPQRATAAARGLKLGIAFQLGQLSAEDKARGIEKMQQQLAKLSDPTELEKSLGPEFEVFSMDAPETATAVQETVGRLVQFLQASMPAIYRDEFTGRPPLVNEPEADRFLRRARAALDPRSVVRSFVGGTVTTDEVRALREVYPSTYAAMAQGAQEAVMAAAEREDPLPYEGRVRLSILLGQPLEPLMRPKTMRRMQALYAKSPVGRAEGAPTPNSTRSGRGVKTTGSVEAIPTLGTGSEMTATRRQR
jgi:hypothetical protein